MRARLIALAGALLFTALPVAAEMARAATGGPVLVDGTDSGFHGSSFQGEPQAGWQYQRRWYEILIGLVPGSYANNGRIAVVGAERDEVSTIRNCGAAATVSAQKVGRPVDFFNGPQAIAAFFDAVKSGQSRYLLVHIVEETFYLPDSAGCDNGMSSDEVAVVDASAAAIAAHVNRGGAFFSQNQQYGWLKTLYPNITTRVCSGTQPAFTPGGIAQFPGAQPIDAQSAYHQCFGTSSGAFPIPLITLDPPHEVALGGASIVMPEEAAGGPPAGGGSPQPTCDGVCASRSAGADRYGTASAVASQWPAGITKKVVIASGENFPDAIVGGPLAASIDAPLLLVRKTSVPTETLDALARLGVNEAYLMGGPAAVDFAVFDELKARGIAPKRLWGSDRYATAAMTAQRWESSSTVVLASGESFTDQLVAARLASAKKGPLLLVKADGSIPDAIATQIARLAPSEVHLVGDGASRAASAVSSRWKNAVVTAQTAADATALAIKGADAAGTPWSSVVLVTAEKFPDALAGVSLSVRRNAPLILAPSSCLPQALVDRLTAAKTLDMVVIGGEAAIVEGIETLKKVCDAR